LRTDNEVCLAWLADALQKLRQEGRTKAVLYLQAVLDEVVLEMKMTPGSWLSAQKALGEWEGVACLLVGERGIERHLDRGGQPTLIRAFRV